MSLILCNSENAVSQNYLAHHGVLGQQWGVQNGPPYPLGLAGRIALARQKRRAKKELKLIKEQQRKEEEARKIKEGFDKKKSKIMLSGNANDVLEYKGHWTNEELQYIVRRLDLEQELSRKTPSSKSRKALAKIEKLSQDAKTVSDTANNFFSLYNSLAKAYNAYAEGIGEDGSLPIVGGKRGDKKKKKDSDS